MTAQDTRALTVPIAMYAVAQHMIDRSLPAPISIDSAGVTRERLVKVAVSSVDLDAWLDSMVVDDELHEPRPDRSWERVAYTGRISAAIGDVSFVLVTVTRTRPLVALQGGMA